jgi:transglutaminase-like putative cysteine protease
MKVFKSALHFSLALLVIIPGGISPAPAAKSDLETSSTRSPGGAKYRSMIFTYQAGYTTVPKEINKFDVWLPLPKESDDQKISDLVVYGPGNGSMSEEPRYKNRIYHVSSGKRGGVQLQMRTRFHVTRLAIVNEDLNKLPAVPPNPPADLSIYLESNNLAPVDDEVKNLAARITKKATTDLGKARAIFDYVLRNIKLDKSAPGWGQGDLKRAISVRKGNSLDLSTAFVGLSRGAGVPARIIVGFLIPRGLSQGTLSGYHAWAEFYQKGRGWVPVDPALAARDPRRMHELFGNLDANRIAFSIGRDIILAPPQQTGPLNFLLYPFGEMDGKKMGSSTYRFSFGPAD